MNDDRNKTELTRCVTQAAIVYFDERGVKPLETEVPVARGWIADLAGVLDPTMTELVKLKLLRRRPHWKQSGHAEWWNEGKAAQQLMTVLVEVKTSRSDFTGDKKWNLSPPTNLAYLALPKTLEIPQDSLPPGWGVLRFAGECVRLERVPEIFPSTPEQQRDVVLAVAVRRDHITRYERIRQLQKRIRAEQGERERGYRHTKAMTAMVSIVNGEHESLEKCIEYHGLKIPDYLSKPLEKLWGCARIREGER